MSLDEPKGQIAFTLNGTDMSLVAAPTTRINVLAWRTT